jgi:hypothetical protein
MKRIAISPKNTQAQTQYWEMSAEDRVWLMQRLVSFQCDMQEISTHDSAIRHEMFRARPTTYPRGRRGANSHASMLAGLTRTLLDGRDITTPQIDALEGIMDLVAAYEHTDSVRFDRKFWRNDA